MKKKEKLKKKVSFLDTNRFVKTETWLPLQPEINAKEVTSTSGTHAGQSDTKTGGGHWTGHCYFSSDIKWENGDTTHYGFYYID